MAIRLNYLHIEKTQKPHAHGWHDKNMLVLHETVTPNMPGLKDILSVEIELANRDYGIHGMNDAEGNMAWAYGCGLAVFYHAGGVNLMSDGIEQVSMIPAMIDKKIITRSQAYKMWLANTKQLTATAMMISAWHNTLPNERPIVRCNGTGTRPGICSHWDVSQYHKESDGHWDCQPHDKGGHYPLGHVIELAKSFVHFGYRF